MDPKREYLNGVQSAGQQEREARLSRAMHTQALASDIADNLHTVEDLLPHQIAPDLAKAVMETLAASAKQRMEAFKRLSDAIAEQPDSQDKEVALRHLELVGRTLPFDGFGGAADPVDEDDTPDGPGTLYFVGKPEDLEVKDCRFDVGSWTVGGHPVSVGVPSIEPIFPNWRERPDNAERLAQTQRIKNLECEVRRLRADLHNPRRRG